MARVYKVVDRHKSGLYSLLAWGKYTTKYIPRQKVERKNLFVFLNIDEALNFVGYGEVWECETDSVPRPAPEEVPDYDYTRVSGYKDLSPQEADRLILEFWDHPYKDEEGPLSLIGTPLHTYLVDDVTLLVRVDF